MWYMAASSGSPMRVLSPPSTSSDLHALSSLFSSCSSGTNVVFRSLIPRLQALDTYLKTHKEDLADEESEMPQFLEVTSRRRHQETVFTALIQQLKGLTEFAGLQDINRSGNEVINVLQQLLEAPRTSREVHWMHLQIDAIIPEDKDQDWQKHWQEGYKEQIQVFQRFLEQSEKLHQELELLGPNERVELLTSLLYERKKLEKNEENEVVDLMPVEEQELLDQAIEEVSKTVDEDQVVVADWFIPRYEVKIQDNGECEWNGLKVTLENVGDLAAECVQFAEKWFCVLNPHIVTLHGACHVGSTPFLVYESTRDHISLLGYVKNVRDTRKMWKRLLDVARGLQYLHSVGIVHGGISPDCMVVGLDGKAKLKPRACIPDNHNVVNSVEPTMESDVYAFGTIILEVTSSLVIEDSPDVLLSIKEDEEPPNRAHNTVQNLIAEMTSSDPNDRPDMNSVVWVLLNLAERERPWNDLQFPELLLHAPDVWTAFRAASQCRERGVVMCARVLGRLERVLSRLWDEGISFADGENAEYNWQTRTEFLLRSMRYLTRYYLPANGQRELLKIAHTRRFTDEIRQIHHQLDALLAEFDNETLIPELNLSGESSSRSGEDWELQWEYDCKDLVVSYHGFLDSLDVLKPDVTVEAMTLMKHELDNFRYAFSDAQLDLVVRTFDICTHQVGTVMASIPEWFVSPYEVRDESWWEGVRVTIHRVQPLNFEQNEARSCEIVLRRADIWSQLVHPHVVELFGACHAGSTPFFVYERARGGSLKEYISRYQHLTVSNGLTAKAPPHLWRLLYETGLGLQYLHERDVVHEELCSDNIVIVVEKRSSVGRRKRRGRKTKRVVNEEKMMDVAKLNGLQLVSLHGPRLLRTSKSTTGELQTRWLAPERRKNDKLPGPPSLTSDIYSFGVIILEMLMCIRAESFDPVPAEDESLPVNVLPSQVDEDAWELVTKMCAWQPELRPPITYVVQQLGELAKEEDAGSQSKETEEMVKHFDDEELTVAPVTIADCVVPGEGQALSISQALNVLKSHVQTSTGTNSEASTDNDLNSRIVLRMEDIYKRLCVAEARIGQEHVGSSDVPEIVASFTDVLTQFFVHVDVNGTGKRITQIAATRQRTDDKFSFHKELDELLGKLQLLEPSPEKREIHDWKRQWLSNRARQTQSNAWTLMTPQAVDLLLDELKETHDREELLAFLRFEMTRHRTSYTAAQVEAIDSTCIDISRRLSDAPTSPVGHLQYHLWRPPRWFIPPYEVEFDSHESLGQGAFASVHMGTWLGTPIVIKKLKPMTSTSDVELQSSAVFYRELSIWYRLNHPYVVKLYGGCHVGGQPFFVCESARNGRLDVYLHRYDAVGGVSVGTTSFISKSTSTTSGNTSGFSRSSSNGSSTGFSVENAVSYKRCEAWQKLRQSALGLQYLHQHSVVHGDLKCDNILVAADGTAKLTDFGLSTIRRYIDKEQERNTNSSVVGAQRWKAPECLAGAAPSFESDVYSFGMCILQAISGEFPWGPRMPDAAVRFHVRRGVLPPRPKGFEDDAHWDLIRQMCCFDPQQRLKLPVVVQRLARFVDLETRRQRGGIGMHMRELLFGGSATSG
ncbi:Tyrosine-protein kinase Btk29A [Phytophthora citrophthora]|uniref:Tyrosine-protein kinase Btk29A n=1 Tax=Phytophthora citrophthora TaxID=4793 RepID=A0AAD9GQU2_9STRA|nr:Tyrosine-protein kinase Btk29A [Phytophthora citrophthora]